MTVVRALMMMMMMMMMMKLPILLCAKKLESYSLPHQKHELTSPKLLLVVYENKSTTPVDTNILGN